MKSYVLSAVLLLLLSACGQNSSPEGRLTLKLETLRAELDTIKQNQRALNDSLLVLTRELNAVKASKR